MLSHQIEVIMVPFLWKIPQISDFVA